MPADVLFVPMVLARPQRAYRLALIATLASTAGGIAGYLLGAYAFEALVLPILDFYEKTAAFETLRACGGRESVMVLLVTSGLSHLPPIKLVTILAGVVQVGLPFFIAKFSDEPFARHALHALAAVAAADCASSIDSIAQLPLRVCDAIHV